MNRRHFLKTSAVATGGLIIGFHLPGENEAAAQSAATPAKLNAWIQIAPDDTVTSLSQLLAEDLECDWKKVKTQFADTIDPVYMAGAPIQGVYGSTAIRTSWDPLRKAGAMACEMLLQAAANRWGVAKSQCRVNRRIRRARGTFRRVSSCILCWQSVLPHSTAEQCNPR